MHIFPYSRRPGTPADKMPGQLGNDLKEERSRRAIAVAQKMSQDYRSAQIGSVQQVLFEEPQGGYFVGHTPNYIKVYIKGEDLLKTGGPSGIRTRDYPVMSRRL